MISSSTTFLGALAGLAIAAASITGAQASPVQIVVDDVFYPLTDTWEISTVSGTANDLEATLRSQAWFGRAGQAPAFAGALGFQLGTPNGSAGPFFAIALPSAAAVDGPTGVGTFNVNPAAENTFATAKLLSPAVDVRVGNLIYTIERTPALPLDQFIGTGLLEDQPWWGNASEASVFSSLVEDELGYSNRLNPFGNLGPLFGYEIVGALGQNVASLGFRESLEANAVIQANQRSSFAVVTNVAPIPLPSAAFLLLGAVGALGVIKRRRA